ncbi:MAG: hypothetical protein V1876_00705 [Candidatus Peregrinibacteria bacterium]
MGTDRPTILSVSQHYDNNDLDGKAIRRDFAAVEAEVLLAKMPEGRPVLFCAAGKKVSAEESSLRSMPREEQCIAVFEQLLRFWEKPDVVFLHLTDSDVDEAVVACVKNKIHVFCHSGGGITEGMETRGRASFCRLADRLAGRNPAGFSEVPAALAEFVHWGRGGREAKLHSYKENLAAFLAEWRRSGPNGRAWRILDSGPDDIPACLEHFVALDVLLQGFIGISEPQVFFEGLKEDLRARFVAAADRARDSGALKDFGKWFEPCRADVEGVFRREKNGNFALDDLLGRLESGGGCGEERVARIKELLSPQSDSAMIQVCKAINDSAEKLDLPLGLIRKAHQEFCEVAGA